MIYILSNPYDADAARKALEDHISKGADIEMKRKHKVRTSQQNRYLHLLLGYYGCEFGYPLEQVKFDIFKKHVNPDIFIRERADKHGIIRKVVLSSTEVDTAEMTTAIERFRNWSASDEGGGLYLPSPDEQQFLTYIEREIEKHKEYI